MPAPRFKKRADVSHVYLPGIGKLREGQVVEGEKFARYCPQFLERTNEPVTPSEPAKAPPPPPPPPPPEPAPEPPSEPEEPAPEPEPPKRKRRRKKEEDEG